MKITTVTYKDDLGSAGEATTIVFEYDGRTYEIDLNTRNEKTFARRVAAAYAPFIAAARDITPRTDADQQTIRDWARFRGYFVGDRGRIPRHVVDAYVEANA